MDPGAVALVAVRFGGELVQVSRVAPGKSFRIGTAPGVDLPCAIATSFPLVGPCERGLVVRCPAGATARRDGVPVDGVIVLDSRAPVVVVLGAVTVTVALERIAPLSRPPIERRPYVFGAFSLFAHLALWLAAMLWPGEPEPIALPGIATSEVAGAPTHVGRYAMAAQTVQRTQRPEPTKIPITTGPLPVPRPAVDRDAQAGGRTTRPGAASAIATRGKRDASELEPPATTAGEPRRFDPTTRPDFDTVKAGPYTTLSTGRAAGDKYGLAARKSRLVVVSCDASSCVVVGGDEAGPIRRAIERRLADIAACYENAIEAGGKNVELDFGLAADGKAVGLTVGGVGDAGTCVSKIIHDIEFSQ